MRLGECYSIPDRYIQELKEYDTLIRVRWGRSEGLVRVERKVSRGPVPSQVNTFDDFETFRDGYAVVLKFPPLESNWPLILFTLAQTDLRRLGGAIEYDRSLNDKEQYAKARRQWNRRDDFRCMGQELYRHMNVVKTVPEGAGHSARGRKPGYFT
jgi:hypothetical protein